MKRLLGDANRLGWWSLPLFIAVGLLGAVLAGSLATIFYSQRVAGLERETAEARRELAGAVERVTEAAEEGIEAIEREAQAVLDAVALTSPVEDALEAGVVGVRVEVVVEQPQPTDDPPPDPDDEGEEEAEPEPPPRPPRTETRYGSGVAVLASEGQAYIATTFALVADPLRPGQAVERVEVLIDDRMHTAVTHAWHPERDLALLRAPLVRGLQVPDWRPTDEPLAAGDIGFVIGLTPRGRLAQLRVTIGAMDPEVLLLDVSVGSFVRGGAIVDGRGRLIGVASSAYAPYGSDPSSAGIPVRLLCERLVRCGEEDL